MNGSLAGVDGRDDESSKKLGAVVDADWLSFLPRWEKLEIRGGRIVSKDPMGVEGSPRTSNPGILEKTLD